VQGNIEESKKSVVLDLHLREAPYAGVCPDAIRDKSDLEHLQRSENIQTDDECSKLSDQSSLIPVRFFDD